MENPLDSSEQDHFSEDENELLEEEISLLEQASNPPSADFYGVLNVEKEVGEDIDNDIVIELMINFGHLKATEDEIKEAYKRLCDSKSLRRQVLTDPTKRMIYDMFGEEGLRTQWEVGARLKTPQELREEFQHQAHLKKEQEIENIVKPRSDVQINIDASQLFNPYDGKAKKALFITRIPSETEITQLFLKHSHEIPLNEKTHTTFVGQMISRNGVGGGNVVGTLRYAFSPKFWAEIGSSVASPRIVSTKAFYTIDPDSFVTITSQLYSTSLPPTLNITGGRRIGTNTTGYLTYKTGAWTLGPWGKGDTSPFRRREKSAVAIGINNGQDKSGYSLELQAGIVQSHISMSFNRKFAEDYNIRGSTTISTASGLTVSIGGDHKVSANSRVAMFMEFGIPSGITLKIRFARLGQRITVPILLSSDFDSSLVLWGSLVPFATVYAIDQLILKPRRKKKKAEKLAALREHHAEFIASQKREAEETIRLLKPSIERKVEIERAKEGLVILEAYYGNFKQTSGVSALDNQFIVDVTIPVQALVNDSQMTIPGGRSKSSIMGFYDPCMGEPKQLKIKYMFKRKIHEIIIDDLAPLACPLRSHIIPNER
ncbi:2692_t:CDS:10 [Ambispora gerdemannii]|uniref:2692_t:CDS:1 n=1 Tax=Ambispora gerdemannii TaxID=144530 RepID=A0A9N8V9W0_9GLOM|nr:2692_t:CDS:10 [Ambispora gerdemannii]